MAARRVCPKCGGGLVEGLDYCRLCGRSLEGAAGAEALPAAAGGVAVDFGPFFSMWVHPRDTIREIVNGDATRWVLWLAAVGGISQTLDRASQRNTGNHLPLLAILGLALVVGPISGIITLYLGGWLVRKTGSWIGGEAGSEQVRAALAWGSVPALWGALVWIPLLALVGHEMFTSATPQLEQAGLPAALAMMAFSGAQLVTAIWAIVCVAQALGEVQGFSGWKALGNMILAGLVILVPIAILAVVVALAFVGSGIR